MWNRILFLSVSLILPWKAVASSLAYVFDGPTICDGCADPFYTDLEKRGYRVQLLTSYEEIPSALARDPALFIIPGGEDAHVRQENWNSKTLRAIRNYVRRGGTYVGVCLGAYWAADWKGEMQKGEGKFKPLHFVPAHVSAHTPGDRGDKYVKVVWRDQPRPRKVFYQDGPEFELNADADVNVLAYYKSMKVAAFYSRYGNGKVLVSGVHVEADKSWVEGTDLTFHPTEDLFKEIMDIATRPNL